MPIETCKKCSMSTSDARIETIPYECTIQGKLIQVNQEIRYCRRCRQRLDDVLDSNTMYRRCVDAYRHRYQMMTPEEIREVLRMYKVYDVQYSISEDDQVQLVESNYTLLSKLTGISKERLESAARGELLSRTEDTLLQLMKQEVVVSWLLQKQRNRLTTDEDAAVREIVSGRRN